MPADRLLAPAREPQDLVRQGVALLGTAAVLLPLGLLLLLGGDRPAQDDRSTSRPLPSPTASPSSVPGSLYDPSHAPGGLPTPLPPLPISSRD